MSFLYNSNLNFTSAMANNAEDDDIGNQRKKPSSRVSKLNLKQFYKIIVYALVVCCLAIIAFV